MISIIIPTYNEAGNIAALINQISSSLKGCPCEIIVVDDDSPDKTWQIAAKIASSNPRVKLCRRLRERGLTSAFNLGIKNSHGDIIGWLDADLSHPPQLLKSMRQFFPKYDVVVASRYVHGGSDDRRERLAVFLSRVINRLAQICLYRDFTDYTSGYILVKKKWLKHYSLKGDHGEYFIDLIFHLKKGGAKIKEIGYRNVSRIHGHSKTATSLWGFAKRGLKYLIILFSLWLKK